jgi:hypothetical protein
MNTEKILYAITVEDVLNVSEENKITFTEKDIPYIEDRIGDYFGSQFYDAIEFALYELKNKRGK